MLRATLRGRGQAAGKPASPAPRPRADRQRAARRLFLACGDVRSGLDPGPSESEALGGRCPALLEDQSGTGERVRVCVGGRTSYGGEEQRGPQPLQP